MSDNETKQAAATSTLANVGRLLGAVGMVLLASVPLTWLLTAESAAADGMKVAFARGVRYESSS